MTGTALFLRAERSAILADAGAAARTSRRYAISDETPRRLEALLDTLIAAAEARDLTNAVEYAGELARARFDAGYGLADVQVAMNALEEAVWRRVLAVAPADAVGEHLRVVSIVLGAAKDALARAYVSLAAARGMPAVDVGALMTGATAG